MHGLEYTLRFLCGSKKFLSNLFQGVGDGVTCGRIEAQLDHHGGGDLRGLCNFEDGVLLNEASGEGDEQPTRLIVLSLLEKIVGYGSYEDHFCIGGSAHKYTRLAKHCHGPCIILLLSKYHDLVPALGPPGMDPGHCVCDGHGLKVMVDVDRGQGSSVWERAALLEGDEERTVNEDQGGSPGDGARRISLRELRDVVEKVDCKVEGREPGEVGAAEGLENVEDCHLEDAVVERHFDEQDVDDGDSLAQGCRQVGQQQVGYLMGRDKGRVLDGKEEHCGVLVEYAAQAVHEE